MRPIYRPADAEAQGEIDEFTQQQFVERVVSQGAGPRGAR
jgi:hypothetical protein